MLQDHALSDISLSVGFIAKMASELTRLRYVKLESGNIIHKARALAEAAGDDLDGMFGGNSGVFLPEEMEAGCIGTMPACYMPEVFRRTWDLVLQGQAAEAKRYFSRILADRRLREGRRQPLRVEGDPRASRRHSLRRGERAGAGLRQ